MAGGPFLLSAEEQDERNRQEMAAFGAADPQPQPPPQRVRPTLGGFGMYDNGMNLAQGGLNAAMAGGASQAAHLAGMIGQAGRAWQNELDSRVAQAREIRRMEHEREIERMRQEAALRKIAMEQEMARMQMRMQRIASDRANGVISSTNWNNPNYL